MSDMERDQPDKGSEAAEDATEDLDMQEQDADQVRGGAIHKAPIEGSADALDKH